MYTKHIAIGLGTWYEFSSFWRSTFFNQEVRSPFAMDACIFSTPSISSRTVSSRALMFSSSIARPGFPAIMSSMPTPPSNDDDDDDSPLCLPDDFVARLPLFCFASSFCVPPAAAAAAAISKGGARPSDLVAAAIARGKERPTITGREPHLPFSACSCGRFVFSSCFIRFLRHRK